MKKLATTMFLAFIIVGLFLLGNLPASAASSTNSISESESITNFAGYGDEFRLYGNYKQTFTRFVNRGHVDILISGDGSTDLDLYVYVGDTVYKSDGNSDDEKVCLSIGRSGYIKIVVVNRGNSANDYQLIIK